MPEVIHEHSKDKVFTTFWNSRQHEKKWAGGVVYSVLMFQLSNYSKSTPVFKNERKHHSEENIITFLREKLREMSLPSQTIRWFVNYSPCRKCSDTINEFIREARTDYHVTIKVNMTFPFLYRIRTPSCEELLHSHLRGVLQCEHQRNVEGLEDLERNGVSVSTFRGKADWEELSRLLSVEHLSHPFLYHGTTRQTEDDVLRKDFRRLLHLSPSSSEGEC